jgi:hypothetical protein
MNYAVKAFAYFFIQSAISSCRPVPCLDCMTMVGHGRTRACRGRKEVNTRPSLGHPGANSGASEPSDRFADRVRGIAEKNGESSENWTRLRFNHRDAASRSKDCRRPPRRSRVWIFPDELPIRSAAAGNRITLSSLGVTSLRGNAECSSRAHEGTTGLEDLTECEADRFASHWTRAAQNDSGNLPTTIAMAARRGSNRELL